MLYALCERTVSLTVAKVLYVASAWYGFITADDRQQGRNDGCKVERDQGLSPNTGVQRARPKAGLGVGCMSAWVALSRCEGPGVSPPTIFENSDAKCCILVTTCCEISCFLENYSQEVGG